MKKNARKIVLIVLSLALVVGAAVLAVKHVENRRAADAYDEAEKLAGLDEAPPSQEEPSYEEKSEEPADVPDRIEPVQEPEKLQPGETDEYFETMLEIDLEVLRQTNEDVLGWITIPDTAVSYPIMYGTDNDYYLKNTWDRQKSSAGSIFLDYRNDGSLDDFNSVIYGHHMKNGSMFACLKYYGSGEYLKEHPSVYIADSDGVYRYDVFAAYEADVTGHTYKLALKSERHRSEYIEATLFESVIDTGIVPEINDRIIVLSTCTGTGQYATRWVIQAVLAAEYLY